MHSFRFLTHSPKDPSTKNIGVLLVSGFALRDVFGPVEEHVAQGPQQMNLYMLIKYTAR